MNSKPVKSRRQPLVALRALRNLLADADRTDEVFVITRALAGDSIERGHARFARTPVGHAVLAERRDLVAKLNDRAWLATLPEGSLGRAYLQFAEAAGITADGLVEASEPVEGQYGHLTDDEGLYARRLRDQHDLWHVVTGYSTKPFGEVCVVAFSYAQTHNLGLGVIALIGALKIASETRKAGQPASGIFKAAWQGWRNGRRAEWLPAQDWEALLAEPLASVRTRLGLRAPTRFQALTEYHAGWNGAATA